MSIRLCTLHCWCCAMADCYLLHVLLSTLVFQHSVRLYTHSWQRWRFGVAVAHRSSSTWLSGLRRARLVLGWVTFTSSNSVHTLSVFNQQPRPTQPGHRSGVGKMSTGIKTGKVPALEVWSSVHNTECLLTADSRPWRRRWTPRHITELWDGTADWW